MDAMTDIQYYSFFFFVSIITTLLIRSLLNKPTKQTTSLHLPPSPPALPLIGHLHLLTPFLYKSFHSLSKQYGPLLYLRFGSARCLLVSSASVASEIFKSQDLTFSSRPIFAFADKLQYGDYWRFMKKLCVTKLFATKQLDVSRGIRREEIERLLRKVVESARKNENVDVDAE